MRRTIGQTLTPDTASLACSCWPTGNVARRVRGWPTSDAATAARGVPAAPVDMAISVRVAADHRAVDLPEVVRHVAALATRLPATLLHGRVVRPTPLEAGVATRREALRMRAVWPSASTPGASPC